MNAAAADVTRTRVNLAVIELGTALKCFMAQPGGGGRRLAQVVEKGLPIRRGHGADSSLWLL